MNRLSEDAVQSLQIWAERGPTHAQVDRLEATPCPIEALFGFTIRSADSFPPSAS